MRLILLRHGETLWNMESRLQGHANSCLSPKGINQAMAIKERIQLLSPSRIITSDLGRTVQTAEIVGHPEAVREPLLRELNMGEWTGRRKSELIKNYEEKYKNWRSGTYTPPKGENWFDFCDRIGSSLREWVYKEDNDLLAVVHSGVIRAACKVFLNLSPEFLLPATPGTITILNFDFQSNKSPKLEAYNISAHIPDENVAD
ncbi:histidine phosphatase family protein [Providencia burhodogranariea]|uniref:Phosphoglycerate mutase n=1 Tax=Providencia burhodogranariea DSM 19968 TaxID=1141662 RepID=K8WC69_9GAMM|nr:histidine phosphatase family protein [Providencia burhodogranariea]EKT58154.1 phosphoglycerate mutase [Providencia burhodogranariea DSM 19968]